MSIAFVKVIYIYCMDIHGLAELAKVLPEALAHELFDRITAYK